MSNNTTTSEGVPATFQAFFNTLDGRRDLVKADSVKATEVSTKSVDLTTDDGEVINLTGVVKDGQPVLKTKRKAK